MPFVVEIIVRHTRCYRLRSMTLPALGKDLSTPGLLSFIRQCFGPIQDARQGCAIPLVGALMSDLLEARLIAEIQ